MPAIPSTTRFALAPVAGMVVRGSQQPVMISHYPPPVSGVVGGVAPPPCVVVLADRLLADPLRTRNLLNTVGYFPC